jgi:putative phosphoesterase
MGLPVSSHTLRTGLPCRPAVTSMGTMQSDPFERYAQTSAARRDPVVPRIPAASAAFLSDIHGNVSALRAVIAEIAQDPVEIVVLSGDITWGTYPSATVDLIDQLESIVGQVVLIRGNAERAVLELTDGVRRPETPRESWMVAQHRASDIARLRQVLFQVDVDLAGLGVVRVCHGSPRADIEAITPRTPMWRLAAATADVDADVLVTGHTHIQFDRTVDGLPRLCRSVNPGSVGLPYHATIPGAYWARTGACGALDFKITGYDLDAHIDGVLATDDPAKLVTEKILRVPPTLDEIVDDVETRMFAD